MTTNRTTNETRNEATGATAGATAGTKAGATAGANAGTKKGDGKFYCNIGAFDEAERARHKELTEKLIASRAEIAETEKGYEFQFRPSTISVAELADWVAAESKCCPFFDFQIDVERGGRLLRLRLSGDEGVKPFMRAEFQIPAK
jgi:hypothetical protein